MLLWRMGEGVKAVIRLLLALSAIICSCVVIGLSSRELPAHLLSALVCGCGGPLLLRLIVVVVAVVVVVFVVVVVVVVAAVCIRICVMLLRMYLLPRLSTRTVIGCCDAWCCCYLNSHLYIVANVCCCCSCPFIRLFDVAAVGCCCCAYLLLMRLSADAVACCYCD